MIRAWYNEQFSVQVPLRTPDGYGNDAVTYADGQVFPAGLSPVSQSRTQAAEQDATSAEYGLSFDPSIVLTPGQRVRRLRDGALYEVLTYSTDYTTPLQATAAMRHSEVRLRRVTIP